MTDNDPGYTHRVAEAALERIRALSLSADPAHYEIWYAYAAGQKPGLNQAINDTLAQDKRLTDIELEQIYEQHFSPSHTQAGLSRVGGKVSDTIDNAIQMLDELISERFAAAASSAMRRRNWKTHPIKRRSEPLRM